METTKSPESTGVYCCPSCSNRRNFVGLDSRAYPGADCECGAYGAGDECTCLVTLKQSFVVDESGEPEYSTHDGGYDAEIGSYTEIRCSECDTVIWHEVLEARPDA